MNQKENNTEKKRAILVKIIVTVIGIIAGYAYFYFIGCRSGACPLRANPYYNMLLGGLLGYIVADWIIAAQRKRRAKDGPGQKDETQ